MPRSRVNALSQWCSLVSKGGNSVFIAAIASAIFPQINQSCWIPYVYYVKSVQEFDLLWEKEEHQVHKTRHSKTLD